MEDRPILSAERKALLERRLKGTGQRAKERVIPKRPEQGRAPLSFAQSQIWLIDQMTPGTPAYNLPVGYRIKGQLNVDALERSLNVIVQRHEALRTTFASQDGEPIQIIHTDCKITLVTIELGRFSEDEREARLHELASEEAIGAFDLSHLPLIRISLYRLGDAEHVLIINVHHIVADGLSIGLMMDELDTLYAALINGSDPNQPALAIQYGDFSFWQRQTTTAQAFPGQVEYWQRQLHGTLPVLSLPGDLPRPPFQSFNGSNVFLSVSKTLAQDLMSLGAREGCTFFMTLLAAFQVLLQRYSGADDIVIGTPVAARTALEVQPLIGNFLNIAALRGDVSGNPTFIELLKRSRNTTLDAFSNSDLPFEAMVNHLKIERDPSRNPIFQAMLQVLSTPTPRIGDLEVSSFHFDLKYAQFDLSLHLYEKAEGYLARFEYCADLFFAETIERLSSNFERLLQEIVKNPEKRISELPILSDAEDALLRSWNATERSYESGIRLGDLIQRSVKSNGAATAVTFEGVSVSYDALHGMSWKIALRLRQMGAKPGGLVGVCLERSVELVSTLVGVVYSGSAYVPLDPSYPASRLAGMCDDAALSIIVTRRTELSRVGAAFPAGVQLVVLDEELTHSTPAPDPHLCSLAGDENDPAYVIFTSGSTGRPKGAMNSHTAIVNRLLWMQDTYDLTTADRVMQKTPYSFDVSVWEFFWPLITGASIVVARPEGHRDSAYLVDLIRRERVTVMHFVPSMLGIFLEEQDLETCTTLRRVICSGEALPYDFVERFFARMPHSRLANLYGPTEAAVDVTVWECRPKDPSRIVPIGRPIANTQMHVLNGQMCQVPVGAYGELYIGGVQVGMGYVSRPDLTTERFLEDRFRPGGRLYKTGDIGRWRMDGSIEYMGRIDHQVKIRGFRIELGEIETGIARHPAIREVVVLAREDVPGDKRLVAYIVAENAPVDLLDQLRAQLRAGMPEYMLPAHFVSLDTLPLTENGKVDRKALPPPGKGDMMPRGVAVASRSATEEIVMGAFMAVLGRADFGVLQNFFDLGGNSLSGAQLMFKLRAVSGFDLPLRNLFEHPTVAGLAEVIDGLTWLENSKTPPSDGGNREEIEL